ncbi:hypothetical protein [Kaarinaea lacus]
MIIVDKLARARQFFRSLTLFNFSHRYPKIYLALVTISALAGYLYLLMFPTGAIFGIYQFSLNVSAPITGQSILTLLTWVSVTLFCAGITHGIVTLRFREPEGIQLKRENAQLVFNKLEEIRQEIKWPAINNVILTRRFELSIIKTPIRGLPFWSRNTLVIGYPFMQTLPPEYFDCALTRKLLQFSKRRNLFINWLSFLRVTWLLYPESLKQRNQVGDQFSYWFFSTYGRFYRYLAVYVTQTDEVCADTLALDRLNDRDVFKTAESIRLVQFFLNQHFWPKLNELLARGTINPAQIKPYEHLSKSILQVMKSSRITHWLKILSLESSCEGSHEAPFARRMHAMGYGKMIPPKACDTSAAQYYFGPDNIRLTQHMNKLWASHVMQDIAQTRKQKKDKTDTAVQQRLTVAF